jgi:chromosomal replication initiation ATPase DnaA
MNNILDVNLKPCTLKKGIYSIALQVCSELDVSISDVRSKSRKAELVEARHEIATRAKVHRYTREQIGDVLNRDHSSVTHLINDYTKP